MVRMFDAGARRDRPAVVHDRVVTVANGITLLRLLGLPLFVWLMVGPEAFGMAFLTLVVVGTTDWVDGYVARRFNQVSELGKVLDPAADRILLGTAVVSILASGAVPAVLAWPIVVREVLVSIAAIALALAGARRIDVQWVGKAGTFALMTALPLFLAGASDLSWAGAARALGWVFAVPGIILGWVAAAGYVPLARRALAAGRTHPPLEAGVGSSDGGISP